MQSIVGCVEFSNWLVRVLVELKCLRSESCLCVFFQD